MNTSLKAMAAIVLFSLPVAAVAQSSDASEVDLHHGRQLGRHLQRLDHAGRDGLAQPRHLLGRAPQRRSSWPGSPVSATRGRLGRRLLLLLLGRLEDILLADAPADAGALQRREVDAMLGGQLADQWRDVGAALSAVVAGAGGGCRLRRGSARSRRCLLGRLRGGSGSLLRCGLLLGRRLLGRGGGRDQRVTGLALLLRSKTGLQAAQQDAALRASLGAFPFPQPCVEALVQLLEVLVDEELIVLHPELR